MRFTIPQVMLNVAEALSRRSTCPKLQVGAVLVDDGGRILGTGYNGVPRGMPHCIEKPCAGANAPKGADLCEAVHAEQNALMQCRDTDKIYTLFCTHAPCMRCTKMLLNTSCVTIVFLNGEGVEPAAEALWLRSGRAWLNYKEPP